ncbi:MAG: carboxypeptidase-like regulatory domain-containing protein [Deltaproteobacteria bacterium]
MKLCVLMALMPGICLALEGNLGDEQAGIFYTITHLHPATYIVLFLIFVLSVANLIYQGWLPGSRRSFSGLMDLRSKLASTGSDLRNSLRRARRPHRGGVAEPRAPQVAAGGPDTGVVGERRVVKQVEKTGSSGATPLDGINHPLPSFSTREESRSGAAPTTSETSEREVSSPQFKFASAVEAPGPEEIERRNRERLVVTGSVSDPDGKGIASVIVYLTDEEGNRLGQSCRSMAETGEFKVQVNQPGRYLLKGYKRGFFMEETDPQPLPIESGKIEGYVLRMAPEECVISGKVLFARIEEAAPHLEVRCVDEAGEVWRAARVSSSGEYRIDGLPFDFRCFLEVRAADGMLLCGSESFSTGSHKEIHRDLTIPPSLVPPDNRSKDTHPFRGHLSADL